MSWIAQLTGHANDDAASDAPTAEADLARKLQEVARELTNLGHVGVAATFTGDHTGTVNLLAPPAESQPSSSDALGGATPQPPAPGETQPPQSAVPDGTPAPLPTPDQQAAQAATAPESTPGYISPPQQS